MKESQFNIYKTFENRVYCFNTLTKATIRLEKINYISETIKSNKETEINLLYNNGFIVDDNYDERSLLEYIYNKKYFDNTNRGLILLPTLGCNFKCPYCFEKNIKICNIDRYFDRVMLHIKNNMEKIKTLHLAFFGGEPLLFKDKIVEFLKEVRDYCEKSNVILKTSMVTNGSLLDENIIHEFGKSQCQYIQITIDGDRNTHDNQRVFLNGDKSFDLLVSKLEMLSSLSKEYKYMKSILRLNIENQTLETIKKTLTTVDEEFRGNIYLLIRKIFSTCYYKSNSTNNKNELADFYDIAKNLGYKIFRNEHYFSSCEACNDTNSYHILPDLSLVKCVNDLTCKDVFVGKILDSGKVKWNHNNLVNWYNAANFSTDNNCRKCNKAASCLGGCILYKVKKGIRACTSNELIIDNYL